MGRLVYGLWLLLGQVIAGCVIVPVPGSLEGVDFAKAPVPAVENLQEGIVVLATRMGDDEHGMAHCVRNAMQRENSSLRLISPREFRDALFPWLDLQAKFEELRARLSDDPLLRKAIAELNVRYAIFVSEEPQKASSPVKGSPVGVAWYERQLSVSADVWDVKRAHDMGSVQARASGTEVFVGVYPMGVVSVPVLEGVPCRGLGEALARTLSPGEQ